ncbi:MAG TPA: tRNA pseudouridine(13) synthase TruD [Candidatus Saccharimonadales bacterium]|nr:tRNA pseudouridine(13) synthase TruD [Candidatus Saccharimonadales bacterium]
MITLTKSAGIGGELKNEPEDFTVKEITSRGFVLEPGRGYAAADLQEPESPEGKFTTFVLEKRNWETIRSILEIAKRMGKGRKSIGYAGTKDKRSVSVQLACIYGVEPANVSSVGIKDIKINGAWKSDGIELGSNLGNSFSVRVRGASNAGAIPLLIEELNGLFPDYFDRQRFGYRLNNFRIGMSILNNDFEAAVMTFLTDSSNESDQEAVEARKTLAEEMDFQRATSYFPRHLRYERTMIDYLARYKNYANAIRKIPRGIALMFVHSVEALIFNAALEDRIRSADLGSKLHCRKNFYGFPEPESASVGEEGFPLGLLIGYETKDEYIGDYENLIMEKLGISKETFKIKGMPELSMKGTYRQLLSPFRDFSYSVKENDATLNFSIPTGAYATIFLGEITKSNPLELSEIAPQLSQS